MTGVFVIVFIVAAAFAMWYAVAARLLGHVMSFDDHVSSALDTVADDDDVWLWWESEQR